MSHSIDDFYSFYKETLRRARKDHECDACHETISKGHRYYVVSWHFMGNMESIKRCARCQAIHAHLQDLGMGEFWPAEKLDCGEGYEEHWGKNPPDDIAALAFALPGEIDR